MRLSTWALPILALAGASLLAARPALAVDPVGYTAPDGVNTIPDTLATPHPVTCISGCASAASPANFTPGQASVGTTATLIVAARAGRQTITIEQLGSTTVYLGGSGVTTSTGIVLPGTPYSSITLNYSGALYGITASGSQPVAEYELY